VDNAGNVSENCRKQLISNCRACANFVCQIRTCKQDVNEEISAAAALEEDTERWQENGEDDFDDIAILAVSFLRTSTSRENRSDCSRCRSRRSSRALFLGFADLPVKGMMAVCTRSRRCDLVDRAYWSAMESFCGRFEQFSSVGL